MSTSPTESFDTRLDNTLETLAEGWRSWIHSELDGTSFIKDDLDSVERVKDEAKQAIRELVLSELISEWHSIGNWNSDKGIAELWPVIEKRLAELNGGKDE